MTQPIRVYPAGPMSSRDLFTFLRNLDEGIKATAELYDLGFAPLPVFCDFIAIMQSRDVTVQQIKAASLAWVEVAEVMVMLPGWEDSLGATAEREAAVENDIPVMHSIGELLEWRRVLLEGEQSNERIIKADAETDF